MSLDHEEILQLHDKAYQRGEVTRERAADDLVFYWVTQWDDNLLGESQLQYRGEFNVLRKAGRQILSDLNTNPIQVDFDPVDGTDESGADIIDGMYRADMRNNTSQEAKDNALSETVVCGVGAWELRNEYKTNRAGDMEQVIRRYPLYEANNNVFWDPNARLMDKSDADYVSCLVAYSKDGYKKLRGDISGDYDSDVDSSFANPEISYAFPWLGGQDSLIYVARFFHRKKVKVTVTVMQDMYGETKDLNDDELKEQEDDLIDTGWTIAASRTVERYVVTRYLLSGEGVLEETVVPGEHIPVVPEYGERAYIEGEEHYEGITRLAKDPQRLRNFQLSYLSDIVSRSPRTKPIFYPEQIQGFEDMYEENGADNNYPYLLQNMLDANGNPLPIGAQGQMPEQQMPQALMVAIQESRMAIDDVASPGLPQDIVDPDASGKAVLAMQNRLDMQSYVYQKNHKTAMRRDGEIYASMARDIYDTPREVILTSVDGSSKKAMVNQEVMNPNTLEMSVQHDMKNMIFDVYADIGPAFQSVKAQNREEIKELINGLPPGTPTHSMMLNEYLTMIDGVAFKDIRNYANKQLMLMGIRDPETEEDKLMVQQAQQAQQQQPDSSMVMAQAEMLKAQADMLEQENRRAQLQLDSEKVRQGQEKVALQAQAQEMDTLTKAANIDKTVADTAQSWANTEKITGETMGNQIDNLQKVTPQVSNVVRANNGM